MKNKFIVSAIALMVGIASVPSVNAMYEDEIGKYDWEIKTVWGSQSDNLVQVFPTLKKTFVFSETSFGSIDTKTGVTSK